MIEALIILAAAAARFAQGNGYAGPGRWSLAAVMLLAGWYGPLDGQHLLVVETWAVASIAIAGWATVAMGYTKWEDWKYSLMRYSIPTLVTCFVADQVTGRQELMAYIAIGPILTAIYYFVQQHGKPEWLQRLAGGKDVAAAMAGATVGALVLL